MIDESVKKSFYRALLTAAVIFAVMCTIAGVMMTAKALLFVSEMAGKM